LACQLLEKSSRFLKHSPIGNQAWGIFFWHHAWPRSLKKIITAVKNIDLGFLEPITFYREEL